MDQKKSLIIKLRKLIDAMPLLDEKTKNNWHAHLSVLPEENLLNMEKKLLLAYEQMIEAEKKYQNNLEQFQKEKISPVYQKNEQKENTKKDQTLNNLINQIP